MLKVSFRAIKILFILGYKTNIFPTYLEFSFCYSAVKNKKCIKDISILYYDGHNDFSFTYFVNVSLNLTYTLNIS